MNRLGKISLLLSLFCFLTTFGFKLAVPGWMPIIGVGLGFAIFFLIFAVAINFKFLLIVVRSESTQFLTKSFLTVLVTFIFLGLVNFLLAKSDLRFDLTDNGLNSLSSLSVSLLDNLEGELQFHYFHSDSKKLPAMSRQVRSALSNYLSHSDRVTMQSHAVFKRPDLVQKFQVGEEESTLFAQHKNRIERVNGLEEKDITSAILKLSRPPKTIYFLLGHKERRRQVKTSFGLSTFTQQLEKLHYKTADLDGLDSIPSDIAVLVMVGPVDSLTSNEVNQLNQYILSGGRLLVAVDPGEKHQINSVIKSFGLNLSEGFVYSAQSPAGRSKLLSLAHPGPSSHPMSQPLIAGQNPAFFVSGSFDITEAGKSYRVTPLLFHLPGSVMRKGLEESSSIVRQGELPVAALVEGEGENSFRMVVVADSDFLTNQFYKVSGNFMFSLAVINGLAEEEDLLKLQQPQAETTYLTMTQTQLNIYFLFFVLPMAFLFFVVAVFFRLRRVF